MAPKAAPYTLILKVRKQHIDHLRSCARASLPDAKGPEVNNLIMVYARKVTKSMSPDQKKVYSEDGRLSLALSWSLLVHLFVFSCF